MKGEGKTLCIAFIVAGMLFAGACSNSPSPKAGPSAGASVSASQYVGHWDLTVKTPTGNEPSWIGVSEANGQVKVLVVGFDGSATPAATAQVKDGTLEFSMPPHPVDYGGCMQMTGKLVNGQLVGTAVGPKGATLHWTGRKAPALEPQPAPQWGKPIRLFNGRNLDGWKFSDPKKAGMWKVEHGVLEESGDASNIITHALFKNFKLHLQFKCWPMSNSGVFLRGRYEVQIETDSATQPASHHTGGVYGFLAPNPEQPRRSGVWQTYDITFVGRTITVVQNGITVIDQKEIPGITGGALNSDEAAPGPIYLQGSEAGRVAFRDIVITPEK